MKITSLPIFILVSLIAFFSSFVAAQTVPAGLTYQGRITDANGNALPDGTGYTIEVRLWNTPTGGANPQWGSRYSGVTVKNGVFGIVLGSAGGTPIAGAATTSLEQVFTSFAGVYLGLTITRSFDGTATPSPSEISPRQQLLSSPYAFRASLAKAVDANAILTASIKDGEVKTSDIGNGEVQVSNIAANAVIGEKIAPQSIANTHILPGTIMPDRLALDYAVFWEEQAGDFQGGTTITGWLRRTLNKSRTPSLPSASSISRNSNTITLQNGVYLIRATGPMYASGSSQLVLRDVTGSPATPIVALRGTSDFGSQSVMSASTIEDYLTVTNGPRQYELWQYFSAGDTNFGGRLGVAVNQNNSSTAPDKNIYSRIHIQKVQ